MIRGEIEPKSRKRENRSITRQNIPGTGQNPPRTDKCGVITKALITRHPSLCLWSEHLETARAFVVIKAKVSNSLLSLAHTRWLLFIPYCYLTSDLTRSSATFFLRDLSLLVQQFTTRRNVSYVSNPKLYHIHFSYKFFKHISTLLSLLFSL